MDGSREWPELYQSIRLSQPIKSGHLSVLFTADKCRNNAVQAAHFLTGQIGAAKDIAQVPHHGGALLGRLEETGPGQLVLQTVFEKIQLIL